MSEAEAAGQVSNILFWEKHCSFKLINSLCQKDKKSKVKISNQLMLLIQFNCLLYLFVHGTRPSRDVRSPCKNQITILMIIMMLLSEVGDVETNGSRLPS